MKTGGSISALFLLVLFLSSCDKSYQVRFTNYYIEEMDSVIVGDKNAVFTNVNLETSSSYTTIKTGNYMVKCVSKSKKKFYSSINFSTNSAEKRSIQLDGIG